MASRGLMVFFLVWVSSCRAQKTGFDMFRECVYQRGFQYCCQASPAALDLEEECPAEVVKWLYNAHRRVQGEEARISPRIGEVGVLVRTAAGSPDGALVPIRVQESLPLLGPGDSVRGPRDSAPLPDRGSPLSGPPQRSTPF